MKINFIIFLLTICFSGYLHGQAKYIFLFIGDGMGMNQINVTEMYLAEMENRIGITPLNQAQEEAIYQEFKKSFIEGKQSKDQSMYQSDERIASVAIDQLNQLARLGWTSGSHSAGYVPVFAIGAGEDLFKSKMDNTDIPLLIMNAIMR